MSATFPSEKIFTTTQGKQYSFSASLAVANTFDIYLFDSSNTEQAKYNNELHGIYEPDGLFDNRFINEFEYTSEFNSLVCLGSFTYTDLTGKLFNYVNSFPLYLIVFFSSIDVEEDASNKKSSDNDSNGSPFIFLVNRFEIIEKTTIYIKYKLHFVSSNWPYLLLRVKFSNYGSKENTEIFSIIKQLFKNSNVKYDETLFNDNMSRISLKYATSINDNCFTATRYLLDRIFFYPLNIDSSMKFLYYDEISQSIKICDLLKAGQDGKKRGFVLDVGTKASHESLLTKEPINVKSLVTIPNIEAIKVFFPFNRKSYSYDDNAITTDKIDSNAIYNFANSIPDSTQDIRLQRYLLIHNDGMNFSFTDSYYNTKVSKYSQFYSLILNNAIYIDAPGKVDFHPGSMVLIGFPSYEDVSLDMSLTLYDSIKLKYQHVINDYVVSRVHHFVYPANHRYKLNLMLFRNYSY